METQSYKTFGIVGQYPKYITIEMIINSKDGCYFFICKDSEYSNSEDLKNNDIFQTIKILNAN